MTQKILIIKLGALGDFILALGLMKGVRLQFPQAHIALMTSSSLVKLANQTGFFDEIIINNREHYDMKKNVYILKHILADRKWDYIFDFQHSFVIAHRYQSIARFLTKHPMKWGFVWGKEACFFETPAKWPYTYQKPIKKSFPFHESECSLDFCKGSEKYFHLLPETYVLMIPGCSPKHPHKRWPKENYSTLVQRLAEKNIHSVILGADAEKEEVNFIAQSSPMAINFLNKAELLDIPQLAKRALCVVSNDTGPMHMASFVGTKTIVLFGEKTKNSAQNRPNIINLFGKNIADITVDEVERYIL